MINPSYGVCASGGDGGMVAVSTQLVVPSNDTSTDSTTTDTTTTTIPTTTTTTSTTTTDQQAEREAHIAEVKARKQDRKNDQQLRQDEQQNRREDRRADQVLRKGPKLSIEFFAPENGAEPEVVKVTNNDDQSAFISSIASATDGRVDSSVSLSLSSGGHVFLLSGIALDAEVDDDEYVWYDHYVCSESDEDDGFVVSAGLSTSSENHNYTVLCNGSTPNGSGSAKRRRRRKARKQASRNNGKKN